jgi:small subunit ribosomal protein S8
MSRTDPIADLLTLFATVEGGKVSISMPVARQGRVWCSSRKASSTITGMQRRQQGDIDVTLLRYHDGRPVIDRLDRVSTPSLRVYRGKTKLPRVMGGFGVAIVSTSLGLMTDREARARGQGGEVVCIVA